MKHLRPSVLYMRKVFLIIFDIIAVLVASVLAIAMRFDFNLNSIPEHFMNNVWTYMIINVVTTLVVFWLFRLYNSLWKFAGAQEFQNMVMACFVNAVLLFAGTHLLSLAVPRSYYFMFAFWQVAFTFASRFAYRFLRSLRKRQINEKLGNNVMIVGAGEATSLLLKEILNSDFVHMTVKCLVDDDSNKQGRYIQGVKVCGKREDIPQLAEKYDIDEIIISMPAVSHKVRSEILAICQETNCKLQTLPGMYQLVNNEVSVSKLRDVEVEDLLGRDPVSVDLDSILGYVRDKTVLVTGGGGSIGSELCRQIAQHKPAHLVILDIYENSVYDIQQELKRTYPDLKLTVLIASVRNTARMEYIFATYKPDIVYHAAAHKHVPLMEDSPHEAIKNNVFGTYKTATAAAKNGVKRFVMISTDKAVNPTNIMGASKRICEMIIQTLNNRYDTEFVAVRFGNVLGSNGSVIPLFKKQIAAGGPVTVTDPNIIRYFMTIPEAVSLVLQAGAYAKGGEIFVLDMGEPVRIYDLAVNLIKLSGYVPNEDIMITFTGLRPGEKLYEEMLMKEEGMKETANHMIHIGKPIEFNEEQFLEELQELEVASRNELSDIRPLVQHIVPTYNYHEQA